VSGDDYREPVDTLEIAVVADERRAEREGSGGYPQVVLIEREAACLLSHFHARVAIGCGNRNGLAHERAKAHSRLSTRVQIYAVLAPVFPNQIRSPHGRSLM
jgi:hypothetical protein